MADIYCICCKQLSSNNYRNVFDKKLLINSQEKVKHEEPDGYMTLRNAIELITGYTISETDNAILCETCFHKVESYIKFRSQLVASFGKLSDTEVSDLSLENVDIANINSLISNASNTDSEISKEIMNIKRKDNISPNCSNLSSIEAENDSLSYPAPIFHHFVDVADIVSDNVSDNISDYVSDYEQPKRKFLTYEDKISIFKEIQEGKSQEDILKTYGISKSCLYNIIKNIDKVTMLSSKAEFKNKKCKRSCNDKVLEECLIKWIHQVRALGQPISGPILQAKALQFNKLLNGPSTFKASNGWLERFKNRHGIRQFTIPGEMLSNNSEAAKIFCEEIREKIKTENLLLENVYNADESGIYWKTFPNTTLASQEEKSVLGRKDRTGRVTALFCCNATGTNKINLCVIGNFAHPRSIKNIKNLPVTYKSERNGWMSTDVFTKWYKDDFIPAVLEYKKNNNISGKVLLLLDNAPSHPPASELNEIDKQFEVKYLPPNATALIQPMNQGAISITKKLYKKEFLFKLLKEEQIINIDDFLRNFTLRDCINLISQAWQNIQVCTLSKIWKPMLGYLLSTETLESSITIDTYRNQIAIEINNESFDELDERTCQQLQQNNFDVSEVKKWMVTEEEDEGWQRLTDAEIIESLMNCQEFYQEF